nr:ABC transporter permease [Lichenibacterium sp. 6Y81]
MLNGIVARLIGARILTSALILFLVSVMILVAAQFLPGDVAQELLGQSATPEAVAGLRHAMHLDQPAPLRFLEWLMDAARGRFGNSLVNGNPVSSLIGDRLRNTAVLAAITAAVSVPLSLAAGVAAAILRDRPLDRILSLVSIALVSVPEFLVATLAVLLFAVKLRWLPALSSVSNTHSWTGFMRAYALPVMTLACVICAQMFRMTRAAVIDALRAPHVEMALLKGASRSRIVLRHALPNAVGPVANAVALSLSFLFGGVIIVEVIFNYPGMAKLTVDAVSTRDMPLLQACALIFSAGYLALVSLADIAAILSNPRLRHP